MLVSTIRKAALSSANRSPRTRPPTCSTLGISSPIRAMLASGMLPPPVFDARCKECSLREICQPEALAGRERLKRLAWELFSAPE